MSLQVLSFKEVVKLLTIVVSTAAIAIAGDLAEKAENTDIQTASTADLENHGTMIGSENVTTVLR